MTENLRTLNLSFILICNIIGAGVFIVPTIIFKNTKSVFLSIFIWVFAAGVVILMGLCYSELGSTYPFEGGDVIYLSKAYGKVACLIFSIVSVFAILPLGCALMTQKICGILECERPMKLIAMSCLLIIFVIINYKGNSLVIRIQYILTLLKMIVVSIFILLAVFVFFNIIKVKGDEKCAIHDNIDPDYTFKGVSSAFCFTLWSYDGWNTGNFIAHKIHNPARTFPRAITLALIVVSSIYVLINISYFYVLPASVFLDYKTDLIKSYFLNLDINNSLQKFFAILINVIPPLGTLNGSFLVGASIIDSLVTEQENKSIIRAIGIFFFGILVMCFSSMQDPSTILNKISFCTYLFYGLSITSILVLRKKDKDVRRDFKIPNIIIYLSILFAGFVTAFSIYLEFAAKKPNI